MWQTRNTRVRRTQPEHRGGMALLVAVGCVLSGCAPDAPEGGFPTHPGDRFAVTLEWDAPATDAVGGALDDLAGYRLYYSDASPPSGPGGVVLEVGLVTRRTVGDLAPGIYFFAVTAYDRDGNESIPSGELQVEVGGE